MPNSPILQIPQVASGQTQKEITINAATAILEAAMNDSLIHVRSSNANFTLNETQWTRYFLHRIQGTTAEVIITHPARERFFVVSNEGTGPIKVRPSGGGAPEEVEVPAGKIVLCVCDGTKNYAVSSGVSRLTDLADVVTVPASEGQVLFYSAVDETWRPGTISEALSYRFTELLDTPGSYTEQALKLIRVNAAANALEFVTAPVHTLLGLTDGPESYTGQAFKVIAVKETEDGFEFVDAPPLPFTSILDGPGTYDGAAGKLVAVSDEEDGIVFVNPPVTALPIEDESVEVTQATKLNFQGAGVIVTEGAEGEAIVTISGEGSGGPAGAGPHAYWRVRAYRTGANSFFSAREVEFRPEVGGADQTTGGTALASSVLAGSAAGNAFDDNTATFWKSAAGDMVSGDGAWIGYQFAAPVEVEEVSFTAEVTSESPIWMVIEYSDDGTLWHRAWTVSQQAAWTDGQTRTFAAANAVISLLDMADVPDNYDPLKLLRVRSTGDGFEYVSYSFLNLSDTPSSYSGQALRKVRVNSLGTALELAVDNQAANVVSTKSEAYTPTLADAAEKTPVIPVSVSVSVDVTIPANADVAYPVGTQISVLQAGTAQVGIVGDTGVTVNRPAAFTNRTREQHSLVMALKTGTNTWNLFGDLEATV